MAQDVLITPASTKIAFTDSGDTTTVLRTSSGRFEFKDSGESNFVDIYANDIVLDGNLTVGGTTTTVNTSNILIEDPILQLAKGQTSGSPTVDIGFVGLRGDSNNAAFIWDESADQFAAILTTGDGSSTTLTPASYAGFKAGASFFTGGITVENSLLRITSAAPNLVFSVPSGGLDSRIFNDGSGNFIIGHGDNSDTPTERLRINSSGNTTFSGNITVGPSNNSKIYMGGNDYIGFTDGVGDGFKFVYDNTERLRITNVGKVGIGTNAPDEKLHIEGAGNTNLLIESTSNHAQLVLKSENNTYSPYVVFKDAGADRYLIQANPSDSLLFRPQGTSTTSKWVVFNSNGSVGIGTETPGAKLHVNGYARIGNPHANEDQASTLILSNSTGGSATHDFLTLADTANNGSETGRIVFKARYGTGSFSAGQEATFISSIRNGTSGAYHLAFGTTNDSSADAVERVRISSLGNVGIGTTTPGKLLELAGGGLRLPNGYSIDWNNENTRISGSHNSNKIQFDVGGVSNVLYLSNGSVGIGTNAPSEMLHINKSSGTGSFIRFQDTGGGGVYIGARSNVMELIGTTSPSTYLDVEFSDTTSYASGNGNSRGLDITNAATDNNTQFASLQLATLNNTNGTGSLVRIHAINENSTAGASSMAFTTRNASSTISEKMRIQGDGNVGIGTDNPGYKLDIGGVSSSVNNTIRLNQNNGGTAIRIGAGGGGSDVTLLRVDGESSAGNHDGATDSSEYGFSLRYMGARNGNANSLSIFSDNQTAASQIEAVTIYQDGNVGIGTSSPTTPLHVVGNTVINGVLFFDSTSNSFINRDSSNIRIAGENGVKLQTYVSGWQDRLTVIDNGNVGIGTTSPSAKLHIQSEGSHDEGAEIVLRHSNNNSTDVVSTISFQNNAGQVAMIQGGTTGANNTGYISFFTDNAGTSSEKLRILGNGNIGIGRSTAHGKLDIAAADLGSSSGDVSVVGRSTSDVGSNSMYLLEEYVRTSAGSDWTTAGVRLQAKTDSTYQGYIQFNGDSNNYGISFGAGAGGTSSPGTTAERMRIQSDGNVGIGTTAPADLLHLSSTAPSIILDKTETGWGSLRFYKAGSQVSYIQLDGSEEMVYYQPSGLGHLFYAGGVAALKIQSDGKVGIGTTSPNRKLHVYGSAASAYLAEFTNTHATQGYGVLIKAGDDNNVTALSVNDKDGNEKLRVRAGGQIKFYKLTEVEL